MTELEESQKTESENSVRDLITLQLGFETRIINISLGKESLTE